MIAFKVSLNFDPFFNHLSIEKNMVMITMRKKLNIFTLQLPIYYILNRKSRLERDY